MSQAEMNPLEVLRKISRNFKGLPISEQAKALQLARQVRQQLDDEPIRLFTPHGGQAEFLKQIEGGFIVISGAGNGWGKSELMAAIFAAAMWPDLAPPCFGTVFQNWQHPKRARIYSKPAELEDIGSLQTAISRWFPKGRYSKANGKYRYPSVYYADSGWILDLFSYERHESEAAGPNIGLQGFNEPPPEPLWKEAVARSRAGGYILGGFTSLLDNVWVVDGILNKADGKDIRVRYGSSCENCKQHGINGNLEHDKIMQVLAQFDQDEREARFTGKPLTLSGRIYKAFDRNVHVAKEPIVPPGSGVTHFMVVDPAIGKPLACLWAFVGPDGVVNIYDEHPETTFQGAKDSNNDVEWYANLFRAREQGRVIHTRILDRHFGNSRRTLGGKTLKQEFAEKGIEFVDSYAMDPAAEVETGIMAVKGYLNYDKSKKIDPLNCPRIIVSPTCHNTIAAFERWGRNPETGKPMEEYKDFMDDVRYLVKRNPVHEVASTWTPASAPHYGVGT